MILGTCRSHYDSHIQADVELASYNIDLRDYDVFSTFLPVIIGERCGGVSSALILPQRNPKGSGYLFTT